MKSKGKGFKKKEKKISNMEKQISTPLLKEGMNLQSKLLINIDNKEQNDTNYKYIKKEIIINNNNDRQKPINMKKQIYKKIRYETFKPSIQKAQISKFIYKTENHFSSNNLTTDYSRYYNNSKYLIKNPVKEKSKKKLFKNKSQGNNIILNKNIISDNNKINNSDINEFDNAYFNNINTEEENKINNTNYNFRPGNNFKLNINNTEYDQKTYRMDININKNKGGKIALLPIKKQNISSNKRIKANPKKYHHIPRESHISFIYDYSKDVNKDSFFAQSPKFINHHLNVYPLKQKIKKRKNGDYITVKRKSPQSSERLKHKIEVSRIKFEKIREIEKKIKDYFNSNGLSLENRVLYDQSATMIQSAFRAYYSRMKLFNELNSFVNIGFLIDILKKIFFLRKSDYWENFLKGILSYLSFLNNINNNTNTENLLELNNEKPTFTELILTEPKPIKKKSKSFRKLKVVKKLKKNNNLLFPQTCVFFNLGNDNDIINKENCSNLDNINERQKFLEEELNKILIENEQLKKENQNLKIKCQKLLLNQANNNIMNKDIQKSMELKLDNFNSFYNNKENNNPKLKNDKLKNILKIKKYKMREYLYKYFSRFYYKAILLKNSERKSLVYIKNKIKSSFNGGVNSNGENSLREKNEEISNTKLLKLKNLCNRFDTKRKNFLKNKYITLYYKGLLHEIKDKYQNNNINKNENIENKSEDIDIIKNENFENINKDDKKKDE